MNVRLVLAERLHQEHPRVLAGQARASSHFGSGRPVHPVHALVHLLGQRHEVLLCLGGEFVRVFQEPLDVVLVGEEVQFLLVDAPGPWISWHELVLLGARHGAVPSAHGCIQSRRCGELDGVSAVFEPVEGIIELCGVGFSSLERGVFVVVGHDVVSLGSHSVFVHAGAMRTQRVSQRVDGGFRHFLQPFRHVFCLFFGWSSTPSLFL
mmetsp:Transcript_7153/g.44395  ORF Transcript_7153/g.44395 Transcript_7153/m.44395 type:complete len:208 (-) Transcript_7153:126-749(-)